MSGHFFSAGLRPEVCFGAQKAFWGGSKWCSSDFEGFENDFQAILGHFWLFFIDFRPVSDAVAQSHWSGVTGGGSPPPMA